MKIEGAIFDLDGTLLDSMPIWDTIGEDYLLSLGIKPHENLKETFQDMSLMQSAVYYQNEYGVQKTVEEIIAGVDCLVEQFYKEKALLKEGVKPFLEELSKRGVKMCITTAIDKHLVKMALTRCGVQHYFSEIFTCNEIGYGKDNPAIYHIAFNYLGTKKENTVIFEDSLYAVKTAKKAGYLVAGIYDEAEQNSEQVRKLSDFYIQNFLDMREFL